MMLSNKCYKLDIALNVSKSIFIIEFRFIEKFFVLSLNKG